MPPRKPQIVPRETPPPEPVPAPDPPKPQTAKDFMDRIQQGITDILDDKDAAVGDKLKAIAAGINLAKVRAGIGEDDGDEGMGFAQR